MSGQWILWPEILWLMRVVFDRYPYIFATFFSKACCSFFNVVDFFF
jgi:hypothetical protein